MSSDEAVVRVDFDGLRRCLSTLSEEYPDFLMRAVLIGGGACWFYRALLERADDPDFRTPEFSPDEEERWLSKDLDFIGLMGFEAEQLMPQRVHTDEKGRTYIAVDGVRLGFAQMCFWLDSETARATCRVGRVVGPSGQDVDFFVADPVSLYREKEYAAQRRNAPGDALHLALLREFLGWDIVNHARGFIGDPSLANERKCFELYRRALSLAPEVVGDPRVRSGLNKICEQSLTGSWPAQQQAARRLCEEIESESGV